MKKIKNISKELKGLKYVSKAEIEWYDYQSTRIKEIVSELESYDYPYYDEEDRAMLEELEELIDQQIMDLKSNLQELTSTYDTLKKVLK